MLSVQRFEKQHLADIELSYEYPMSQRNLFASQAGVIGITLLNGKQVFACGGVSIMWPGVGEAWFIMSKDAYKNPISVARYAVSVFDGIIEKCALERVQASVSANDYKAIRFARWLSFESEGVMAKYGPDGSDYYRMARVSQ